MKPALTTAGTIETGYALRCTSNGGGFCAFPLDSEDYTLQASAEHAEIFDTPQDAQEAIERHGMDEVELVPIIRACTIQIGAGATLALVDDAGIVPGSLKARILDAVADGPKTLNELVTAGNARRPDVKQAVAELCDDALLERVGWARGARYQRKG